jgi:hypothetical protein
MWEFWMNLRFEVKRLHTDAGLKFNCFEHTNFKKCASLQFLSEFIVDRHCFLFQNIFTACIVIGSKLILNKTWSIYSKRMLWIEPFFSLWAVYQRWGWWQRQRQKVIGRIRLRFVKVDQKRIQIPIHCWQRQRNKTRFIWEWIGNWRCCWGRNSCWLRRFCQMLRRPGRSRCNSRW